MPTYAVLYDAGLLEAGQAPIRGRLMLSDRAGWSVELDTLLAPSVGNVTLEDE